MKILFINTLRLGDTIMSLHVIRSLLSKYPEANLDYLTFDESKPLKEMISLPIKMHFLERKKIQRFISDLGVSFFRPYEELESNIDPILKTNYDLVINFSNTKISTYIASMVDAKEKIGCNFNSDGILNYGSKWIEYLDIVVSRETGLVHFNEIFLNALELNSSNQEVFKISNRSILETKKYISTTKKNLVLQFKSSDPKKDLTMKQAQELIGSLKASKWNIIIPCMEKEKSDYEKELSGVQVVSCKLDGLYYLLEAADLILTVDTSTKQLASLTKTETIELSLGSSKPIQTGIYKEGSLVLQPIAECYPCPHSLMCDNNYICSQNINIEELASITKAAMAKDFLPEVSSIRVSSTLKEDNFYFLINQSQNLTKQLLAKINLYQYFSKREDLYSNLVFKVHKRFDIIKLKEKLLQIENLNHLIYYLKQRVAIGKPVHKFLMCEEYQSLEEGLEVLEFPSTFLKLTQIPAGKVFDFNLVRMAENFLDDSLKYLRNMKRLIIDIETEGNYETRR